MCSTVVCCHSIVFFESVPADRSGMAASWFIVAAAACVIVLCFAAESRKSHENGSMTRGMVVWQQIFSILAGIIFLLFKSQKRFKIVVFLLWRRDLVLELQIAAAVCCPFFVFCNSVSAARSGMATSRFIVAAAACAIALCFAAESRKSNENGSMRRGMVVWQQIFSILARIIFL